MSRCQAIIRLTDYGTQRCGKPNGHEGPHQVSSPYDSRDIKWSTPENVETSND